MAELPGNHEASIRRVSFPGVFVQMTRALLATVLFASTLLLRGRGARN